MPECLGRGCNYDCGNCILIFNRNHSELINFDDDEEEE